MRTFEFFFGSMLGELVLTHTDNLSKTLKHTSMSAAEGQHVTAMTVATLNSVRSDEQFDQFWEADTKEADKLGVHEPQLPRRGKLSHGFDNGLSGGHFMATPKTHFKWCYFEAIDLIVNCIQDHFDQPGYRLYHLLETLLPKACKQVELE